MQQFYQNLDGKAPITKAEALRQAQLSMLTGKQNQQGDNKRGLEIIPPNDPGKKVNVGYAHPYYWAPFILIGNGL